MAQYPSATPGDSTLYVAKNNLSTSLNGALNAGDVTITVATTVNFPTTGYITIDAEAISYTGTTATTFTGCTRGADGTTAASHLNAAQVLHTVVAAHHNLLKDEIVAIAADLRASFIEGATTIALTFAKYLRLTGGTMSGNIAMGSNKVTGLAASSANGDAVRHEQIASLITTTPVQGTETSGVSTASTTFVNGGASASITPSSTSRRVKVTVTVPAGHTTSGNSGYIGISRNGTDLFTVGNTPLKYRTTDASGQPQSTVTGVWIDSPASAAAVTYQIRAATSTGTALTGGQLATGTQTVIQLEEIL